MKQRLRNIYVELDGIYRESTDPKQIELLEELLETLKQVILNQPEDGKGNEK